MRRTRVLAVMIGLGCVCLPAKADTFRIEIDYMTDSDHDHRPSAAVVNAVVQMFACEGHTLIVDVSNQLLHRNVMLRDSNCSGFFGFNNGSSNSYGFIKQQNFDHSNSSNTWHYCVFGHQYQSKNSSGVCVTSGSSGLATGGLDFVVTLGSFSGETGTLYDQAATLAHEFGHNLGLSHCGTHYCGSDTSRADYVGPYISNMPSIMAYRYQLRGVREQMLCRGMIQPEALFKNIDYSHGRMCTLNENSLDERMGSGMIWTDWNADGIVQTSLAKDISGNRNWCSDSGNRTSGLSDYNEWANIRDGALLVNDDSPEATQELERRKFNIEMEPCISSEEAFEVDMELARQGCPSCSQPALSTESCQGGDNVYLGNEACILFVCPHFGTCSFPHDSIQEAHDGSPWGSVYYLRPKVYNETGSVMLDRRGFWTCDRTDGTALIR